MLFLITKDIVIFLIILLFSFCYHIFLIAKLNSFIFRFIAFIYIFKHFKFLFLILRLFHWNIIFSFILLSFIILIIILMVLRLILLLFSKNIWLFIFHFVHILLKIRKIINIFIILFRLLLFWWFISSILQNLIVLSFFRDLSCSFILTSHSFYLHNNIYNSKFKIFIIKFIKNDC